MSALQTYLALIVIFHCLWTEQLGAQQADRQVATTGNVAKKRKAGSDQKYKRIHQFVLRMIERGDMPKARARLDEHLASHPKDADSHFLLGLYHADQGQRESAVASLRTALEYGLPPSRIVAGPRDLFVSLKSHEFYRELLDDWAGRLVHGPILGDVTSSQAAVWVRVAGPASVRLVVSKLADMSDPVVSESVMCTRRDDFTAKPKVTGLSPATNYFFHVEVNGNPARDTLGKFQFRTAPVDRAPCQLRLAFGGGAGYVPENERMWNTIHGQSPDMLLLLGDNVYIDDPKSTLQQRHTYYRRQSRPEFRQLTCCTPTYSIWDDHDFGINDCWGGPKMDSPAWKKEKVWPIFRQNWPNPGFGGGADQPGCWYAFSYGDIDFVMLDCRYYRTNPDASDPSMLGPVQLAWLMRTLAASQATFKVICSSVPWDYRTKGDSKDTWNGFRNERDVIFEFVNREQIEGVLLLSADRHRSDAWKVANPGGYDFYEFNSSRLTNQHVHQEMDAALFSYNQKQSFGMVTLDTTLKDPSATYAVINIDGEKVHELTVQKSQLAPAP